MTTKKKLNKRRVILEAARNSDTIPAEDPTGRPKWTRHSIQMAAMLKDINPDRFELLSRGFCRHCGAYFPHRPGEGTCERCR